MSKTHGVSDGKPTGEELAEAGIPPSIARPQSTDPNFIQRGKASFRQMLKDAANYKALRKTPYGLRPVIIFTIVSAVAALDGRIFGLAAPEIIRDLDIDLVKVNAALGIVGFFLIFGVIALGYLSDRVKRVPIVGIGAIISGIASLFTARATNLGTLVAPRAADAIGGTALSIPIISLQADYYPPEARGKVFALYGVIGRIIALSSPIIVAFLVIATVRAWRFPYLVTGPLFIVVGIIVMLFLKEPVRGYMERKSLGAAEDVALRNEAPPSFGEAWRTIWAIRTLRRLFIADIPGTAADAILGLFLPILLFQEYGLSILERAFLSVGLAAVALPFGIMAGGLVDVLLKRRPQRVLTLYGSLGILSSFSVLMIALTPPLWVLVVVFMLFGAASALLGPAGSVLYVQILPAHIRTLGSVVPVLAAIPGTIFRIFVVGFFITQYGVAGAVFVAFPFLLVSGLIQLSAAGLFERDMRAALASQIAGEEWRRAKEEGQGKLLVCRDVDVEYDGVQVLFGVDFDVEEGEIIALLGTNGAGKSTLLRAISGTQEASSGAIVIDGRDVTHMPPHEIAKRAIVHMPGGRGVFPGLTVRENILLGTWIVDEEERKARLEEVYGIFPILLERAYAKAGQLSGGEQQMVSLAQAFLNKPRLLMIDELSLGLSPAVTQQLIEIVKKIHEAGTTIIIVEQSVNIALTIAEKAIFMEKGEVKFVGRTAELLRRPDILRAVYVKGTGALAEAPGSGLKSERELRRYEIEKARPILEVRGLKKFYGGVTAVDGVSFALREGEVLGLIGPNGAGKTTVFELISGYQLADEGQVIYDGADVTNLRADQRANLRLVRRFQDARLFPALTVYENLLVALDRRIDVRSTLLTALQFPQVRQSERRVRLRADRLIELLELGAFRDKFVRELSTGLRRITDLACVLAAEPKVLLLDEPSSGIAQAEAEALAPLLRRVRFDTGCSILIIEHDMPLISGVSDELIALDQGRVVVRGTPDEVLNDERVIQSYLGTSEEVARRSGILK